MSELEIFTSMYEDWVGFVQNTLAGHWIIYIIVLVDMIVTTSIAISTTDVISLAKPLNQRKVWSIWLFGGLWGAHWLCLNPENNKYRYPDILPALKAISDTIAQNPLEQLAAYTKAIESDDEILKLDF